MEVWRTRVDVNVCGIISFVCTLCRVPPLCVLKVDSRFSGILPSQVSASTLPGGPCRKNTEEKEEWGCEELNLKAFSSWESLKAQTVTSQTHRRFKLASTTNQLLWGETTCWWLVPFTVPNEKLIASTLRHFLHLLSSPLSWRLLTAGEFNIKTNQPCSNCTIHVFFCKDCPLEWGGKKV